MKTFGLTVVLLALMGTSVASITAQETPGEATSEAGEPLPWVDIGNNLEFRYHFAQGEFALYLLGEVRNNGDTAVPSPALSLVLLDSEGNIVGAQRLIDLYPIVEPETPTPYQVVVDPDITGRSWDKERVELIGYGMGPAECTIGLEVRNIEEETMRADQMRLSSEVYNGGTAPADGVIVWAAFYREDGVYAGMINESIGTAVPADKSALFTLFGLGVPGLPADASDFTYHVFATSTTVGTTHC